MDVIDWALNVSEPKSIIFKQGIKDSQFDVPRFPQSVSVSQSIVSQSVSQSIVSQ